jgi:hypothetical protein
MIFIFSRLFILIFYLFEKSKTEKNVNPFISPKIPEKWARGVDPSDNTVTLPVHQKAAIPLPFSVELTIIMTANARALILSHVVVFVAGFAAGKLMDKDELEMYRSLHESSFTKFRKLAEKVALGMLAMGTLIVAVRASRK